MLFRSLDIMVIDDAAKKKIEKAKAAKEKAAKAEEKGNASVDLAEAASGVADPVKMYLKEMGRISLLTREGEVEIAKRIEAGENETLHRLLLCGVGVERVIELGEMLKNGEVKLKDVINDMEDDDSYMLIGERKEAVINLINRIREFNERMCLNRRNKAKARCTEETKKKLTAKIRRDQEKILKLVSSFSLDEKQVERMLDKFKELSAEVEAAERKIETCMLRAGGKPISYLKRCAAKIPKSVKDDQIIEPIGLTKGEIIVLKCEADSAQKIIKQAKERTDLTPRQIKLKLKKVEKSLENANRAKDKV